MKKKLLLIIASTVLLLGAAGYFYVQQILSTGFDIDETVYIEIDGRKSYADVIAQIEAKAHVESVSDFERVASFLDYPAHIKSGRYAIRPDMTVLQAIRVLKSGNQVPVKLTFNNIRTKEDLAERLSSQLMSGKEELLSALNNPAFCAKFGFSPETIVCMFIPNTYEFYWNVSLDKLLQRMDSEYKSFWNPVRLTKAGQTGLSPVEVSILASIVEEECYFSDEYPVVAGLYINRLNKGQLLQADPTVKFAAGDFALRRVLSKHLAIDSPYNTYKYQGLPPGPIRIPSIKGIDGVLNHSNHSYYYMCAKEDFSMRHNFSATFAEHQRNAAKYQAALNKKKIYQ
ncbi:endolytic transglycosylase MltG [Viscerimonas tarda]